MEARAGLAGAAIWAGAADPGAGGGGSGGGGGGGGSDVSAWLGNWSFTGSGTLTVTQPTGHPAAPYSKSGTATIASGTAHALVLTITSSNGQGTTCPPITLDLQSPTSAVTSPAMQSCIGPGLTTDPNEATSTSATLTLAGTTITSHETGTVTATVNSVPYGGTFAEDDTFTKQ